MIENKVISILGTEYKIEVVDPEQDEIMKDTGATGYMNGPGKRIAIADTDIHYKYKYFTPDEREIEERNCLRHEIIHAFLYESGLDRNTGVPDGGWASYEEMVDFFAMQMTKMLKAFREAGCAVY